MLHQRIAERRIASCPYGLQQERLALVFNGGAPLNPPHRQPMPPGVASTTLKTLFSAASVLLLLLASKPAAAGEPPSSAERIGQIERVVGVATVERAGKSEPAEARSAILARDRFVTQNGAQLLLVLSDSSQIWLGENGSLTIAEYMNKKSSGAIIIDVPEGAVRLITPPTDKRSERRIEAHLPLSMLSTRGADVWAGPLDGGRGVVVLRGRAEVRNDAGFVILDKKWQGSLVSDRATPPTKPAPFDTAQRAKVVKTLPFN